MDEGLNAQLEATGWQYQPGISLQQHRQGLGY